jgi:hypothetical protein
VVATTVQTREIRMKQLMLLVEESQASKEAKAKGLEYMSFGRYGKGGKQTHTVKNGHLVPLTSGGKTASGKDVPPKGKDWSKYQQVTGEVPYHKRQGPPEYIGGGPKPLPRTYKGKNIAAADSAEYMTTGKIAPKQSLSPNKIMQADGEIWNKMKLRSGDALREDPKKWAEYKQLVAAKFKGHTPITQKTLDALENENHHSLIKALVQLDLVDKKSHFYKNPYLMGDEF